MNSLCNLMCDDNNIKHRILQYTKDQRHDHIILSSQDINTELSFKVMYATQLVSTRKYLLSIWG